MENVDDIKEKEQEKEKMVEKVDNQAAAVQNKVKNSKEPTDAQKAIATIIVLLVFVGGYFLVNKLLFNYAVNKTEKDIEEAAKKIERQIDSELRARGYSY